MPTLSGLFPLSRLTSPKESCQFNAWSSRPIKDCRDLWFYLPSLTTEPRSPQPAPASDSKSHEEFHVSSTAGTDKSPEIPVLKPELPPCSLVVMKMAQPGARWLASREHRNCSLHKGFCFSSSKWSKTQPILYSQIPFFQQRPIQVEWQPIS